MDKLVQDIHQRCPNYPFEILAQAEICEDENKIFSQEKFDILKSKKSALPYGGYICKVICNICIYKPMFLSFKRLPIN